MSEQTPSWPVVAAVRVAMGVAVMVAVAVAPADAQRRKARPDSNYDEIFLKYLLAARDMAPRETERPAIDWMAGLLGDPRARRANDLVTVQVVENIVAAGSSDAAVQKKSGATLGVPGLSTDLRSLQLWNTDSQFKGSGSTTRSGELTAVITARVVEVMPNGDLVLEGVRAIEINNDRQMVVLTGVVRPIDIGPQNVVASSAIGQLRIRYFGDGLMKDNLQPGWVIRLLNKIF